MALKDTVDKLHKLLDQIKKDLLKSAKGNKAASQRVRTGSIKFEKIAKMYRKESVKSERGAKKGKKKTKTKRKTATKKTKTRKVVAKKTVRKTIKRKKKR